MTPAVLAEVKPMAKQENKKLTSAEARNEIRSRTRKIYVRQAERKKKIKEMQSRTLSRRLSQYLDRVSNMNDAKKAH